MTNTTDRLERLREAAALKGLSQKRLAESMGLPQSAISNLLAGKRQIKADELIKLENLLGIVTTGGSGLEPIPLIKFDQVLQFEEAAASTKQRFPDVYRDVGSRLFAFVYHEPRLSMEKMRDVYLIVDPDDSVLRAGFFYVLAEGGRYELSEYKDDPPRFQNMWNPTWEPANRLVGSFPFTVLGAIKQFGWRPDLAILKSD